MVNFVRWLKLFLTAGRLPQLAPSAIIAEVVLNTLSDRGLQI